MIDCEPRISNPVVASSSLAGPTNFVSPSFAATYRRSNSVNNGLSRKFNFASTHEGMSPRGRHVSARLRAGSSGASLPPNHMGESADVSHHSSSPNSIRRQKHEAH